MTRDSSKAEKAWREWVKAHPHIEDDAHGTFLDGRASRDAEVAELTTEIGRLRSLMLRAVGASGRPLYWINTESGLLEEYPF